MQVCVCVCLYTYIHLCDMAGTCEPDVQMQVCVCVCVCAYIHISDVQMQATHALSLVVAEHAHNCDRLAALDDPPALAALVALVAAAGHKAASGACRVLANLCDVYGGSVLAALKVPWTRWTYVDVYDVHIV